MYDGLGKKNAENLNSKKKKPKLLGGGSSSSHQVKSRGKHTGTGRNVPAKKFILSENYTNYPTRKKGKTEQGKRHLVLFPDPQKTP